MEVSIMFVQDALFAAVLIQVGLYISLAPFAVRSMPNSSGQHADHYKAAASAPPPRSAASTPEGDGVAGSQAAREWAHDPHRNRPQKRKPVGDATRWRPRETDTEIYLNNHRKNLRYVLKCAFEDYDSLTAESAPEVKEAACNNLQCQYQKLYFLDNLNVMLVLCKFSGEDVHIWMTKEQV